MCLKAILEGFCPKPPVHGMTDPRQYCLIHESPAGVRGFLKCWALRQANDVLDTFCDRYAGGIQDDRVERGVFPIDPKESLHCAVVSGIVSLDLAPGNGSVLEA